MFGEKYLHDLFLKTTRLFYEKELKVVSDIKIGIDKEEMVVRFETVFLPRGIVQIFRKKSTQKCDLLLCDRFSH